MKPDKARERLWIKNPLAIFSQNECGGGVVVCQEKIVELVPQGKQPKNPTGATFDASNYVMLPGLVNTHHHFYQTLTRSFSAALNKPLFPWLKSLYPVWACLNPEDIYISTRLALAELLLSGCTTTADHHYIFPDGLTEFLGQQVLASEELGVRLTLTRGSMSLGEKQGGLPPDSVVQNEQDILDASEKAIKAYHDGSDGSFLQVALAPCSPFSVTTELMEATSSLANDFGVRMHTHLAETDDETVFCLEKFGLRPLDYLESVGWLQETTWLAHGIHFSQEEINRLGQSGIGISHCPSSNMVLGSGICPASELESAGCALGIGVDGSASNDGSNMIQELRMALLLQRLRVGAENVSHHDAFRWGTSGSASCLGRSDIGEISVGKQADLSLFGLDQPRFSGYDDPLAAILLSGAHSAAYVMVGGKWRVERGQIVGLDMDEMIQEHRNAAERLLARAVN
jgi:8-oxoguanine deaminase